MVEDRRGATAREGAKQDSHDVAEYGGAAPRPESIQILLKEASGDGLVLESESPERTLATLRAANEALAVRNARLLRRNVEVNRVNEDLTNLLSSASLPIVFLGPEWRIRRFTPAAEKILGLTGQDVGRSILELRSNIGLAGLDEKIRDVVDNVAVTEHEVQGRDGRWFHLRIQPYRTADQSIDGAVLVWLDVDGLKRTTEDLRRSNVDLENFASFASHELREPLRNMQHYLQLVDMDGPEEEMRNDLRRVSENLSRVMRLVSSLLRFSQVGCHRLERRAVHLCTVVREARESVATVLRETGARVVTEEPMPLVDGDPTLLGDLFSNMFVNATQNRSEKRPHIRVSASVQGGMVRVTVRDNGAGIDLEDPDSVFQLFQRGRDNRGEGSGIGLALCRKVVELHGGHIWVVSKPRLGTAFHFTLPAQKPEGESATVA